MKRIFLYILITCLSVLTTAAKPSFRTSELARLAQTLAIDTDALPDGYSHPTVNSIRLTVHKTGQTTDHIGIYLFSEETRQTGKTPIFDFLERYFLQLKYPPQHKSMSNMTRDDLFTFLAGSLETVDDLLVTDDFGYSYDDHRYQATWQRNGNTLLSVAFPVEYELISGENKIEAEDNLQADISNTTVAVPSVRGNLQSVRGDLQSVRGDLQSPVKSDHYLSEHITNRLYLAEGELIASARHPIESCANMMLSLQAKGDYTVSITQLSYGFKKTTFEVPLRQWIAFCQDQGCKLFFGPEKLTDNGDVEGVVIAVNKAENYNHVLTVTIPSDLLDVGKGTIQARLYPYIPTHNVLNMFAAYKKSNPKTFVTK